MLEIDKLVCFTLSRIFKERGVQINVAFTDGLQPYRDSRVRILAEPISDGYAVGYALDRRLGSAGELSERVRYARSYVRVELIGEDLTRKSGFSSVSANMYRPGRNYEYISFKMDTKDFFMSKLERDNPTSLDLIFNSRQDCTVNSLMVMSSGIPPIVVVPKKGRTIAYFERFGFGRYAVGLDIAQYIASWSAFFPEPKKPRDTIEFDFIVSIEPPLDFFDEMEAQGTESDEDFDEVFARRLIERYQLDEEPSLENEDHLEFRFRRSVTLTKEMLGM
jgi:hypothetical protein